jgi:membrane protein implicated in regulation of membrane protease activity
MSRRLLRGGGRDTARAMLLALSIVGLFVLPSPWNVIGVVVAACVEVLEIAFWRRFLGRYPVRTGSEGMVGEKGEVLEPCSPQGTVRVRGEIWKAHCEVPLAAGDAVKVTGVEGLTLRVEPAAGQASTPS